MGVRHVGRLQPPVINAIYVQYVLLKIDLKNPLKNKKVEFKKTTYFTITNICKYISGEIKIFKRFCSPYQCLGKMDSGRSLQCASIINWRHLPLLSYSQQNLNWSTFMHNPSPLNWSLYFEILKRTDLRKVEPLVEKKIKFKIHLRSILCLL
jgi:hypothetical protein